MKYTFIILGLLLHSKAYATFWCPGLMKFTPWCSVVDYNPPAPPPSNCKSCAVTDVLSDYVPRGFDLTIRNFEIKFDRLQCGDMIATLNQNDDLQFEFKSLTLTTSHVAERWCEINVKAHLPGGLALGTSGLEFEGQYEFNGGGVSLYAKSGLVGENALQVLQEFNGDTFTSDTYFIKKNETPAIVSGCNHIAEYQIAIKLMGVGGPNGAQVAMDVARMISKHNFTSLGWQYHAC